MTDRKELEEVKKQKTNKSNKSNSTLRPSLTRNPSLQHQVSLADKTSSQRLQKQFNIALDRSHQSSSVDVDLKPLGKKDKLRLVTNNSPDSEGRRGFADLKRVSSKEDSQHSHRLLSQKGKQVKLKSNLASLPQLTTSLSPTNKSLH